jgi:di/tricarboxylate transporter
MSENLLLSMAVVIVTIGLLATARLPEYLTTLLFFAAATILRIAPVDVIFSGFASAAFWLVLSGFVLGTAIHKVGLADRIARALSGHFVGSWPRMVGGVVLLTYGLAFVMPSNMGRIALLMPIVMALADRAGIAQGSRGRCGLALAVGFGTFQLSASILPANVPNLVMVRAAESAYGIHFAYMPYLILHAPVLGVLKALVLMVCISFLFPAKPQWAVAAAREGPVTPAEWRLGAMLLVTLALWMTDSVHGIAPAWVGLAAACICVLPRVGFLSGDEFAAGVNIPTCLYVAGILGLAAVVSRTGLGIAVGDALVSRMPLDPRAPMTSFAWLVGLTSALSFVVTASAVPAVFTPLAGTLADSSGYSLTTVLMAQVIGYATPLLPYQAAPIVVAMGMGKVSPRDGVVLCLIIALATFVVLLPLSYLWFSFLGWR